MPLAVVTEEMLDALEDKLRIDPESVRNPVEEIGENQPALRKCVDEAILSPAMVLMPGNIAFCAGLVLCYKALMIADEVEALNVDE